VSALLKDRRLVLLSKVPWHRTNGSAIRLSTRVVNAATDSISPTRAECRNVAPSIPRTSRRKSPLRLPAESIRPRCLIGQTKRRWVEGFSHCDLDPLTGSSARSDALRARRRNDALRWSYAPVNSPDVLLPVFSNADVAVRMSCDTPNTRPAITALPVEPPPYLWWTPSGARAGL
jgi:hypothetical protein